MTFIIFSSNWFIYLYCTITIDKKILRIIIIQNAIFPESVELINNSQMYENGEI